MKIKWKTTKYGLSLFSIRTTMVIRAYTYLHAFRCTNNRVSFVRLADDECIGVVRDIRQKDLTALYVNAFCTPRTVDGVVSASDIVIVVRTRSVHDKRHKEPTR